MFINYIIYNSDKQKKSEERNNKEKSLLLSISRASYTVEAALIVPITIFIIMALIYMAFYMHDKSRIQAIINSNIVQAGLIMKHEWNWDSDGIDYINIDNRGIYFPVIGDTSQENEKILKNLETQLATKLYIAQIDDIIVNADHSTITIKVATTMNISILKVKEFFTGSGTNLILSSKGRVHYPAEFIRQFDVVEGVVDDAKGYDKILETLNGFVN